MTVTLGYHINKTLVETILTAVKEDYSIDRGEVEFDEEENKFALYVDIPSSANPFRLEYFFNGYVKCWEAWVK